MRFSQWCLVLVMRTRVTENLSYFDKKKEKNYNYNIVKNVLACFVYDFVTINSSFFFCISGLFCRN